MLVTSTVEICIQQLGRAEEIACTARRSYASAALGVVILSVCPSVTRVLCDYAKNLTAIFLDHMTGHSLCFPDAKEMGEITMGSPPTGAPNTGGVR